MTVVPNVSEKATVGQTVEHDVGRLARIGAAHRSRTAPAHRPRRRHADHRARARAVRDPDVVDVLSVSSAGTLAPRAASAPPPVVAEPPAARPLRRVVPGLAQSEVWKATISAHMLVDEAHRYHRAAFDEPLLAELQLPAACLRLLRERRASAPTR